MVQRPKFVDVMHGLMSPKNNNSQTLLSNTFEFKFLLAHSEAIGCKLTKCLSGNK